MMNSVSVAAAGAIITLMRGPDRLALPGCRGPPSALVAVRLGAGDGARHVRRVRGASRFRPAAMEPGANSEALLLFALAMGWRRCTTALCSRRGRRSWRPSTSPTEAALGTSVTLVRLGLCGLPAAACVRLGW
jgi:hypothetical protein